MTILDTLLVALRALVHAGSIAAAGSVLFASSFPRAAAAIPSNIQRQMAFGCCLLLLVEPLRYATFQLAIAQHNWSLAFGPDLRWMAFQTPMGRALAVRLIAAAILLFARAPSIRLGAALLMLGSFLIEGHTASSDDASILTTVLLFLHLAAVHWWLGALYPLATLIRQASAAAFLPAVEGFGAWAVPIVVGLLAAGTVLLGVLTSWQLNLDSAYQQRFLVKIGLVSAMLAIAAYNKLRLTPRLARDPVSGATQLLRSIRMESLIALSILAATAWALSATPDM
jgi:putative copper resistance protein D